MCCAVWVAVDLVEGQGQQGAQPFLGRCQMQWAAVAAHVARQVACAVTKCLVVSLHSAPAALLTLKPIRVKNLNAALAAITK